MNTLRVCKRCKKWATIDNFPKKGTEKNHRHVCKICAAKYQKAAYHKKYRYELLSDEKKKELSGKHKRYQQKNKQKIANRTRSYRLKRNYSMTQEEYGHMFLRQGNSCGICKTKKFGGMGKRPQIDHCHTTGKIRGLLCSRCNMGIGQLQDSIEVLNLAIEYLKLHRKIS